MTSTAGSKQAAVFVERVAIRNFKGIKDLEVELKPGLSLLVGRNNAGKSRILRALHIAVGRAEVERDDLTVGSSDPAEIDVTLAPRVAPLSKGVDDSQPPEEVFERALQQLFGTQLALISDSPERQQFAWRTTVISTSERTGARSQSHSMAYNAQENKWHATNQLVPRDVRGLVYAELVDTRRDLSEELRRRDTAVRRILNDLQVADTNRVDLEERLAELGDDILQHSDTLKGLRDSLDSLDRYVDALGSARVDPVPQTLEELARVVGVSFDDGVELLASRLHGSGVRSLASLLVQDVFYGQTLGRDGGTIRPHPVTLIEEPEAHLHPHAISEVARLLEEGARQIVATTHSPSLAASVMPEALLLVRGSPDGGQRIVDFGPAASDEEDVPRSRKPRFYASEMEKLTRLAERPFGDLIFARAIVIGDGATERAFLPPVLRESLGPLAHGISVVDSNGMNDPIVRAVIKFARHVEVPLVVFADADQAGRRTVISLIKNELLEESRDVVWANYSDSGQSTNYEESGTAIEKMMIEAAPDVCFSACESLGEMPQGKTDLLAAMKRHKGTIGAVLAREFVAARPHAQMSAWPDPLRRLTTTLREHLKSRPNDDEAAA
jgi:putative ATP-dependent endonuclease of OLD family